MIIHPLLPGGWTNLFEKKLIKLGSSSPNFRGETNQQYLSWNPPPVFQVRLVFYHGSSTFIASKKTTSRKHQGPGASMIRGTSKFGTFFSKGEKKSSHFSGEDSKLASPFRFHQDWTPKPIIKTFFRGFFFTFFPPKKWPEKSWTQNL